MADLWFSDYITIYNKSYTKKSVPKEKVEIYEGDYKDPIAGPFTEYLLPSFKITDDNHEFVEHPVECFNRLREKIPKIERYLDKEVDEDKIKDEYKNAGRSIYQVGYCRPGDGYESKKILMKRTAELPSNWGDTPLSTHRASYRDFKKKINWCVVTEPFKKPPDNLKPELKQREILKVTTGDSEYGGNINKTGDKIIKESLHGVIKDSKNSDFCEKWEKIKQSRADEPYKVRPPYPVLF